MLKIDQDFKAYLGSCSELSDQELEKQLLAEGRPRDKLVAWNGYLVDGHRRYAICVKYGLPYEVLELDLPDKKAVLQWMWANQECRRNWTAKDRAKHLAMLAIRKTETLEPRQGTDKVLADVAKATGVCSRTVRRAKDYVKALDSLDEAVLACGDIGKGTAAELAKLPKVRQREIVADVKAGKLKSLKQAVSQGKTRDAFFREVTLAVAGLRKAIAYLHEKHPGPYANPITDKIDEIEELVSTWKDDV